MPNMKMMQHYIRDDQKEKLITIAQRLDVSIASLIREAIDLWLRKIGGEHIPHQPKIERGFLPDNDK